MEQIKKIAENTMKNCDIIIWGSAYDKKRGETHTEITFFKAKKETVTPTDNGFKYNVLMFLEPKKEKVEMFSAIIGDPKGYVEMLGKIGYHGIMFKNKAKAKKEVKDMFMVILLRYGFDPLHIKRMIKETVK